MKKLLPFLFVALSLPMTVLGGDKINPDDFICAELVALPTTSGEPSLFEALQIDGYASAAQGNVVADPQIMAPLLSQVYMACQNVPTEKVLKLWLKGRETLPVDKESSWKADKITCGDYVANEDDASGFIIWLDGYNRRKNNLTASVLEDNATLEAFLGRCKAQPEALMLDVMKTGLQK